MPPPAARNRNEGYMRKTDLYSQAGFLFLARIIDGDGFAGDFQRQHTVSLLRIGGAELPGG